MKRNLVASERIEPGQPVVIQDGLVRLAIPHVHKAKDIAGYSTTTVNKGEVAWWDPALRILQRKPK